MNRRSNASAHDAEFGWARVSSFKPQFAALLLLVSAASCPVVLFGAGSRAVPIAATAAAAAAALILLTSKIVHKRGNEYRITTLFYSEVVTVDDVCMTVTDPGPLWTKFRIHLRRPARFGWSVSFVPTSALLLASGGAHANPLGQLSTPEGRLC